MDRRTKKPSASLPFESDWLLWIYGAVMARGKGIRYHGTLKCSRQTDDTIERLNVDVGRRFRLSVWADGVACLVVDRDMFHSEIGGLEPTEVVDRLKKTILDRTSARTFWPPYQGDSSTVQ